MTSYLKRYNQRKSSDSKNPSGFEFIDPSVFVDWVESKRVNWKKKGGGREGKKSREMKWKLNHMRYKNKKNSAEIWLLKTEPKKQNLENSVGMVSSWCKYWKTDINKTYWEQKPTCLRLEFVPAISGSKRLMTDDKRYGWDVVVLRNRKLSYNHYQMLLIML